MTKQIYILIAFMTVTACVAGYFLNRMIVGRERGLHVSPPTITELVRKATKELSTNTNICHGDGYDDPKTGIVYLCVEKDGPRIMNGVPVKDVLTAMVAREDNAWKQLETISNLRDTLSAQINRANEGRSEYGKSPRAADIRKVTINHSFDLKTSIVIGLYTADGVASTLWLDGNDESKTLNVNAVSPY